MTVPRAFVMAVAEITEAELQPYFVLLPEVDLGHMYRGDTIALPIWEARDQRGTLLDLTGSTVWFTGKTDIALPDDGPNTIQCSTLLGGLAVLDADDGLYQVTIPASATQLLTDDTVFVFDVQVVTTIPETHTVKRGLFIIVRDVTRATA